MPRRTPQRHEVKLVWRMSADSPTGEYVNLNVPKPNHRSKDQPEIFSGGWIESSFDLLSGTDVVENPASGAPELDELLGDGDAWADTRPPEL
jgi:hypothetical protein